MGLFGEIFGQGINFAKEIATDSASFVKGVAQVCEPYAREVIDQVSRALGDAEESDEIDCNVEADTSSQSASRASGGKDAAMYNVKQPTPHGKTPQQEASQTKTSEAAGAARADCETAVEAFDKAEMDDGACVKPNADQSEGEDLAQKASDNSSESPRVMVNVDIGAVFGVEVEAQATISTSIDVQELMAEARGESGTNTEEDNSETVAESETQQKHSPLRRYRNVSNWTCAVDGMLHVNEEKAYPHWFEESTQVVLDKDRLNAVIAHVDFCLEVQPLEQSDYVVAPKKSQREVYWELRRECDRKGIEYNKRDIPETDEDYCVANRALRKRLKESNKK